MNITEAQATLEALKIYKGKIIVPFRVPIKDFIITPGQPWQFGLMLKALGQERITIEQALKPYEKDVTILVYFGENGAAWKNGQYSCNYSILATFISLQA